MNGLLAARPFNARMPFITELPFNIQKGRPTTSKDEREVHRCVTIDTVRHRAY